MNQEFIYLIAERLYLQASFHPLCNRNWLFAIYKSLRIANTGDTESMQWTKYNQWKIDHNCRASKSTAVANHSRMHRFDLEMRDEDTCSISVDVSSKAAPVQTITCTYSRKAFLQDLWTFKNPKNETVLLSDYERDALFNASVHSLDGEEIPTPIVEIPAEPTKPSKQKVTKKDTEEQQRTMKFTALHRLLEQIREPYANMQDPIQKSYLEVVIGAAIFYLPSLNIHFNGYISIAALKGYLNQERRVKDHIFPRKLAAKKLLEKPYSLEELMQEYHSALATFMYITPTENSNLVNYYETHENHDEAMLALQIEKFPIQASEKFKNHTELGQFIQELSPAAAMKMSANELMDSLRAFRNKQ